MGEPVLAESVRYADDGAVEILDRRVYPFEVSWVRCATSEDVAVAIERMVTQSTGPLFAATAGMVLGAREARGDGPQEAAARLRAVGRRLVATRPTNNHIRDAVHAVLSATVGTGGDPGEGPGHDHARLGGDDRPRLTGDGRARLAGDELVAAVEAAARAHEDVYHARNAVLGEHAASLLGDGTRVLTHCWADAFLIAVVRAAQAAGKRLEFVCTETRPYLQGARLTAAALVEMGYRPTLITDGMVAAVLADGLADVALTAADRVTLDGHVINKVGTLGVALAARAFDVPFYVLIDAPDPQTPTAADVVIERRDGDEVLHALGRRTAAEGVTGYYPAFDVTPPHLVTRIVTGSGIHRPDALT
ncbi:methylthioribose-1-phosphate isomerase [Planobispora rosea]|uniref:Methylthioribose-1-phosphate isomerase n=1 Tax=Planobispora rosea TaxID=35762 RepID=A0A8J3S5G9_PLARO|nr:methylthioribose-1-phosphate isomerase [Planobispora rosea]GGS50155.1 methylthioribose-1-phosphate isomerase [Planobispora rosea]GIH83893.1 methylthioribose-1-phosphate isomerase [Planobispora rosea]